MMTQTQKATTAREIDHWYKIGAVRVQDLAGVCGELQATVYEGKMLVFFDSERERDDFERRCATHRHMAVRRIARLPEAAAERPLDYIAVRTAEISDE